MLQVKDGVRSVRLALKTIQLCTESQSETTKSVYINKPYMDGSDFC